MWRSYIKVHSKNHNKRPFNISLSAPQNNVQDNNTDFLLALVQDVKLDPIAVS